MAVLTGTPGNDIITGTSSDDEITGQGGDDVIDADGVDRTRGEQDGAGAQQGRSRPHAPAIGLSGGLRHTPSVLDYLVIFILNSQKKQRGAP